MLHTGPWLPARPTGYGAGRCSVKRVFGRRDWQYPDAFVEELFEFAARGFAAQAALLCFAVVHPSDFLGKAVADVFGAGGHLAQGLKYLSTGGSG